MSYQTQDRIPDHDLPQRIAKWSVHFPRLTIQQISDCIQEAALQGEEPKDVLQSVANGGELAGAEGAGG